MMQILDAYAVNPLVLLYGLLSATYGLAVVEVKARGNGLMVCCYVASAVLHGLIAIYHIGHV
jgi:hypothetical protein